MTEQELSEALSPMVVIVGKPLSVEQVRAWHLMLDDLDFEAVRRGVIVTMREHQFGGFPPVGVVRRNSGAETGNLTHTDRAIIAWSAVKRAVEFHGGFATVDFDDPIVTATIRALGGWVRVCDTEAGEQFDVWLKKDFVATYNALMHAGVAAEQTQPLPGLCDQANSATGYADREPLRLVETGLPEQPKRLVRGEKRQAVLTIGPAVRRLAETMGYVETLGLQPHEEPAPSLSADEQKQQFAAWQGARPASEPTNGVCGCCATLANQFIEQNGKRIWLCQDAMQEHEKNFYEMSAQNSD